MSTTVIVVAIVAVLTPGLRVRDGLADTSAERAVVRAGDGTLAWTRAGSRAYLAPRIGERRFGEAAS